MIPIVTSDLPERRLKRLREMKAGPPAINTRKRARDDFAMPTSPSAEPGEDVAANVRNSFDAMSLSREPTSQIVASELMAPSPSIQGSATSPAILPDIPHDQPGGHHREPSLELGTPIKAEKKTPPPLRSRPQTTGTIETIDLTTDEEEYVVVKQEQDQDHDTAEASSTEAVPSSNGAAPQDGRSNQQVVPVPALVVAPRTPPARQAPAAGVSTPAAPSDQPQNITPNQNTTPMHDRTPGPMRTPVRPQTPCHNLTPPHNQTPASVQSARPDSTLVRGQAPRFNPPPFNSQQAFQGSPPAERRIPAQGRGLMRQQRPSHHR